MNCNPTIKTILAPALTLCLVLAGLNFACSQGKNEEVTVIAPYIPSINNAAKVAFKPEITQEQQDTATYDYNYINKPYGVKIEPQPVEPLKYGEGDKAQLYRNFAKIGFANYFTPYLDFMASSVRSEKLLFGARLKHFSSQGKIKDYPPSAYSHNLISVFGKSFSKTHTLSADLGYNRDVVHFYGFAPDSFPDEEFTKDDIKQRFQHVNGEIEFSSNYKEKDKLNHLFRLGFHYFNDLYETRESEVNFLASFDKSFKAGRSDFNHAVALDLGLEFLGYRDSISSSSPFFFQFKPMYRLIFSQYRFQAGLDVNLAATDSPSGSSVGLDVFPLLKAEVIVIESKLSAYAEIAGERTINSFRGLAVENPFIISTPEVAYTDEQIRIGGGITGNAGGVNFEAGVSYSLVKDMPLYVTDTAELFKNRFSVIYDDINLLKVKAGAGYVKAGQFSAKLMAGYYYYNASSELKAWHLPEYEIDFDAGYTFLEKYTVKVSALASGGRYAPVWNEGEVSAVQLKGAFDLGAGFEYEVNHMITAYADVNNILNQHYQLWYNYPVQGILAMIGAKISF